jgi:hypothetical protein
VSPLPVLDALHWAIVLKQVASDELSTPTMQYLPVADFALATAPRAKVKTAIAVR